MLADLALAYLRRFPIDQGKHRVVPFVRLDRLPVSFVHRNPRTGVLFDLDLTDRGDQLLYLYGSIERNSERQLRSCLSGIREDLVFFDCGANMGYYSLLLRKWFPKASIHAFEPHPRVFERLRKNIALNGFGGISTVRAALSDREGRAPLFVGDQSGISSLLPGPQRTDSIEIDAVTVDAYCERRGIFRVDIMKLDVEGSEAEVLRGAKAVLERNPSILLIVEMMDDPPDPARVSARDLLAKILSLGFKAYRPRGWPFGLARLEELPAGYFDNVFFSRVLP